ncbi:MAG: amidohydrolase family protein [Solirubrobacterales bacterium]
MNIDIHQHHWSEQLLAALSRRKHPPYARRVGADWIVTAAGEADTPIRAHERDLEFRRDQLRDTGIDLSVIAPSSPIGAEDLPFGEAQLLIDAYLAGVADLPEDFRHWGTTSVWRVDPAAVEAQLDAGAVGLAVPAGALAAPEGFERFAPVLELLERRGAPLFVHPGPGPYSALAIGTPKHSWWPALTRYIAEMNAAWHAFLIAGRPSHPQLKVVYALLAGLAPLHAARLEVRGGPAERVRDPLVFYDTSSYGPETIAAVAEVVGAEQLVFGSDMPVVSGPQVPAGIDPARLLEQNPARLLGLGVAL